ncbi:hypothetical protein [Streptomyces sp. NPDC046870]|uniref:hypothetical protein n=1 Tax=Streptomyces sp. NPDC046870 TaxID=3155135 RepID=UPI003451E839
MEHNFYRGSARRTEVDARRRVHAVLALDEPVRWHHTAIDLRHQLKGSRAAIWCLRILRRAGVRPHVLDFLSPVLFHIEGLVYRGDIEYETAQQEGTPVGPEWRTGIEEILRAYRIEEPGILAALAELEDYFHLESDILAGRTPLRAELIAETCYSRCSGATLLLRIGCRLAGLDPDERFFTLVRHLSAHDEISTDLPSYTEDRDEGMFNVFRLATWVYDPPEAGHHLKRHGDEMLRALRHDVRHTDHATLTLFAAVIPPVLPLNPRFRSMTPKLLPRPLLAALVNLRIHFHSISKAPRFPQPLPDPRPEL